MVTSARVVPTSTAASPLAPLPLEAAVPLLSDQQGRLLVNAAASAGGLSARSFAPLNANGLLQVATGAGKAYRVTVSIYAGAGWVQLHNAANLASVATATRIFPPVPIPTTVPAWVDLEFDTTDGLAYTAGLVVAVSTTGPTYTAPAPGAAVADVAAFTS